MESIYALAMTKSHRTTNDKELIGWKKTLRRLKGLLKKQRQDEFRIAVFLKRKIAKWNYLEQNDSVPTLET